MYNYLKNADSYEVVVDGTETSYVYWTMNANLEDATIAWNVGSDGGVGNILIDIAGSGARAVVEINK